MDTLESDFRRYMKRLLLGIALLMILATFACAATLNFAWDPAAAGETWSLVRIYERVGAAAPYTYTKVIEVPGTAVTASALNVPAGTHTYIARSVAPDGVTESNDSNAVTATLKPGSPANLKFTIP